ncbi:hypothetical protein OROHE_021668 [Orobanche hederae]
MAADQRKRRANAASLVGCTSREQYRVIRKKLQIQKQDINLRPNISLEWDNNKKVVVSKREQIGITRRHLISFIEPGPPGHSMLADVFSVPQEIFELENLSEIVSYEVWQSYLSDNERRFLSQFLPKVPEPDRNIRDLLAGDNFHFGNPFLKWGASLCYGELHPDIILHEEQSLKAGRKAYYSDLQKYHYGMIENLQVWKEKWASCKDPEVDIVQNIWSSRWHERSVHQVETRFCGNEETLVASPESCSCTNSEMAYSSDNQNLGTVHVESQRRNGFLKTVSDNSSIGLKVVAAISKKGEHLHKRNIQHTDGAKYMSYIKVSREQHERVKSSLKHASNSIHSRSINNVLGIDALNVHPYERFVEEEKKKLHQHWVKLASKDILEGFANWRKRQLQRQKQIRSLGEEIGEKLEFQTTMDEKKEDFQNKQTELSDDIEEEILPSVTNEGIEKEQFDGLFQQPEDTEEAIHEMETKIEDESEEVKSEYIFEERMHDDAKMTEDEDMPNQVSIQDHNQQQQIASSLNNSPRSTMIAPPSPVFYPQNIVSASSNPQDNSMEMGSHASAKTDDEDLSVVSDYPSSSDVWPVDDVHGSYYQATATNAGYAPAGNLQFNLLDKGAAAAAAAGVGKDMPHGRTQTTDDDMSFFNPYSNQDRNELLHSLFKGHQSNLTYHHHQQQKHSGLDFQHRNNLMVDAAHFPGHFMEPTLPLDSRQKRPNDYLYHHLLHHPNNSNNIQESSMFTGGSFAMPVNNIHDWTAVNSACIMPVVPSQPQLLSQGWYNNNGTTTRDGWPSLEVATVVGGHHNNHLFSSSSSVRDSSSDQTLFSVLSECNELPPRASYDDALAGNYTNSGGGVSSNFLQESSTSTTSNYLNEVKMNSLGLRWMMGMPQQNSGMQQESLGKSFLRSWNQ